MSESPSQSISNPEIIILYMADDATAGVWRMARTFLF